MTRSTFTQTLIVALFIPSVCYAQIDSLKISNNSNVPVSFKGDKSECVGQVGAHTIRDIPQPEFNKLCKGTNCEVAIYPSYSCTGSKEYYFDFNLSYGVGVVHGYNYPSYIQVEGFQNKFIINKLK